MHRPYDHGGTDKISAQPRQLGRRDALKGMGLAAAAIVPLSSSARASSAPETAKLGNGGAVGGVSPTRTLADYAVATSLAKLPAAMVERTKKVIFDELASAYFGRKSPGGSLASRYVEQFAGSTEAPILGTTMRASAAYAAMANGTAGHGDEVDGAHVVGGHPGASIVHAASAMAVKQKANGAELINAVALGYDVGVRMVEACGGKFTVRDRRHLTSDFLYALGCTAASARLLGLDAERHCHALALVTFQANGLYALYDEKLHISKSFCNGQYAFAGISSALMAQAGLEGNEDIIGSENGLTDAWGDGTSAAAATRGLGSDFKIAGANFKFINAGYPIHSPVEAALTLVRQNRLAARDIQSILIGMPANALKVVNDRDMANISVQNMVTANVVRGGLKLADFPFPEILGDPAYQRLRKLVSAEVDPDLQREFPNGRGARVTITTVKGARHSLRIDNPLGHSLRGEPSWDDLWKKWRDSLPGCDVTKAFDTARKMEALDDAGLLLSAFSGVMS